MEFDMVPENKLFQIGPNPCISNSTNVIYLTCTSTHSLGLDVECPLAIKVGNQMSVCLNGEEYNDLDSVGYRTALDAIGSTLQDKFNSKMHSD
jgi:hypothetical protein